MISTLEIIGDDYPRVTTIIEETKDPEKEKALLKWMKKLEKIHGVEGAQLERQKILDNGTALHKAIEDFLHSIGTNESDHPMLRTIIPFLRLLIKDKDNELIIEKRLFCHKYKFKGKPDLICSNFEGLSTIFDWTTSTQAKKKQWIEHKFIQAGAYAIACEEIGIKIEQLAVVVVCKNPRKFQIFTEPPKQWRIEFLKRLGQYQQLKREEFITKQYNAQFEVENGNEIYTPPVSTNV
ncbi:hypothetical protein [Geminocystis sp. NIES-3709]|uniref:hypothetical protein n=1 Tax=Geminocystis sp. NIES-3709 TaxID=1617448 RepID=UPI0005FC7BF0|nr:hypothetical protein [Geminocystis sp. NIES-3709]BAQ65580.1 hypothetical protein GM3709_2345 [Geminocystis sp. NIES-3709]